MERYEGFEAKKMESKKEQLPAGGYIARIISAKEYLQKVNQSTVKKLEILFDITQGEYTGIFRRKYEAQSSYNNNKWTGAYRINVPDKTSQYFNTQNRIFGNLIYSVEKSNGDYKWDWNEAGLAGKFIGVLFGEREYSFNGYEGVMTECYAVTDTDSILNGNFTIRPCRKLQQTAEIPKPPVENDAFSTSWVPTDDDLPF